MQDDQIQAPGSVRPDSDRHFELPRVREIRPESHPLPADGAATGSSPSPTAEAEAPGVKAQTAIGEPLRPPA